MNEVEFVRLKKRGKFADIYSFLKLLPKGGLLHVHLTGAIPVDSILEQSNKFYVKTSDGGPDASPKYCIITSREWNRLKFEKRGRKRGESFRFYEPLTSLSKEKLEEVREALVFRACAPPPHADVPLLPLYRPNPYALPEEFERKFTRLEGISLDFQMMRHFLWKVLESLWEDNVEYAEIMVNPFDKVQTNIKSIRYAFGKGSRAQFLSEYINQPDQFEYLVAEYALKQYINDAYAFNACLARRMKHKWPRDSMDHTLNLRWLPKRLNIRFLIALKRGSIRRRERLRQAFRLVDRFHTKLIEERYRDHVLGINIVGDEFGFVGRPTDYLRWMIPLIDEYPRVHVSLHAGESSVADGHVFDSILLGAERIGHGLSLQHSKLAKKVVKDRKICIETCLLSNKILGFIPDTESHPAKDWVKEGIRVCLNTDDPGIFETTMTDEFYYAVTAFDLSLAGLKHIAMESLRSSFVPKDQKAELVNKFSRKFDSYVRNYNCALQKHALRRKQ